MSGDRIMNLLANTRISAHPFKGLAEATDILVWVWDYIVKDWKYLMANLCGRQSILVLFVVKQTAR
jgi:hypothetical protein